MRSSVVLLALLLPVCAFADVRTANGDAVLRNAGKNAVAILVDTNGDHSIDQGFLLESELPLRVAQNLRIEKARVLFDDGYVRLFNGETVYELYVAGYPEPPAAPANTKLLRYTGDGITHRAGETRYDIAKAEKDEELHMPGW